MNGDLRHFDAPFFSMTSTEAKVGHFDLYLVLPLISTEFGPTATIAP